MHGLSADGPTLGGLARGGSVRFLFIACQTKRFKSRSLRAVALFLRASSAFTKVSKASAFCSRRLRRWSVMRRFFTCREATEFRLVTGWKTPSSTCSAITAQIRRNSIVPTQGRTLHGFFLPQGSLVGVWAVHPHRADGWLTEEVSSFEQDGRGRNRNAPP